MKYELKKTLHIATTLDSSEAIMFNQGGRHQIVINPNLTEDDDEDRKIEWHSFDEIVFSVQMVDKGRFDFITGEARKQKQQWEEIHKAENKEGIGVRIL